MLAKWIFASVMALSSFDAMAQCYATGSGSGTAAENTCPKVRISQIDIEWTPAGAIVGNVEVAIINPNNLSLPSSASGQIAVAVYLDSGTTYNPSSDSFYTNAPNYDSLVALPDADSVTYAGVSGASRSTTSQAPKVTVLIKKPSGTGTWYKYSETFGPTSTHPVFKGAAYHQDGELLGAKYDIWADFTFYTVSNPDMSFMYLFGYSNSNDPFALSAHVSESAYAWQSNTITLKMRRNLKDNSVNSIGTGLKWKGGTFFTAGSMFSPGEPMQDYLTKEFIHLPSQSTSAFFDY